MWRIALTTKKPSPSSPMFKSEMSTSYGLVLISNSASGTLSDTRTSKPASCRTAGSVSRMLGSSSTNRTRGRVCPSAMESSPHAKLRAVRRDNHTHREAKGKGRTLNAESNARSRKLDHPIGISVSALANRPLYSDYCRPGRVTFLVQALLAIRR